MGAAKIIALVQRAAEQLRALPLAKQVEVLNAARDLLHQYGPFADEPVDLVSWVPSAEVEANDYNPNAVAPPEMRLLEVSILADGYTQPIVADREDDGGPDGAGRYVVVDGFHRNRVGRECTQVRERVKGYLPVVQIRDAQAGRPDRMASTVRHNRARGKHQVEKMSQIVLELKRRNWTSEKIGRELGMDPDEVLRLYQVTGLAEAFKDHEFSKAWEADLTADDEAVALAEESIPDGDDS